MEERVRPSLTTIPTELLLKILELLSPNDISNLSVTCHALAPPAQLWRDIVHQLLTIHDPKLKNIKKIHPEYGRQAGDWLKQAKFILPKARWLGYHVSSKAHNSRMIRISATYGYSTTGKLDLRIVAERAIPINNFDRDSPPVHTPPLLSDLLPVGAAISTSGTSYQSPRTGPGAHTPDQGLSVDLLDLSIVFRPLFSTSLSNPTWGSDPDSTSTSSDEEAQPQFFDPTDFSPLPRTPSPAYEYHRLRLAVNPTERTILSYPPEIPLDQSMYTLFTGRAPKRPWPTWALYGATLPPPLPLVSSSSFGTPHLPKRPVVGALRGLPDWINSRGNINPLLPFFDGDAPDEGIAAQDKLPIRGFSLDAKIIEPNPVVDQVQTLSSDMTGEWDPADDIPRRNTGVGPNGGPAILWNGQAADPDAGPGVAIIRVGGNNERGGGQNLVFQLGSRRTPPVFSQRLELRSSSLDSETFFPVHPPHRRLSSTSPLTVDPSGEILASSLEGMWCGTYGAHGLELGHLVVRCFLPEDPEKPYGEDCPRPLPNPHRGRRVLEFVKLTGDPNVPTGMISWIAELDSIPTEDLSPTSAGSVDTVTNEDLLHWSSYSPPTAVDRGAHSLPPSSPLPVPNWSRGTFPAAGRVALTGFVHPSWTPAEVILVRSTVSVPVENDLGGLKARDLPVVDEIRLRWAELGKVSCFRRVRV
ncbi:hypothetical protein T439DRAFT_345058 [Meredithblackwellia eburnea MCA 4105]